MLFACKYMIWYVRCHVWEPSVFMWCLSASSALIILLPVRHLCLFFPLRDFTSCHSLCWVLFARATCARCAFMHCSSIQWFCPNLLLILTGPASHTLHGPVDSVLCNAADNRNATELYQLPCLTTSLQSVYSLTVLFVPISVCSVWELNQSECVLYILREPLPMARGQQVPPKAPSSLCGN